MKFTGSHVVSSVTDRVDELNVINWPGARVGEPKSNPKRKKERVKFS